MSKRNSNAEDNGSGTLKFSKIFDLINLINKKYDKVQRKFIQDTNLTPSQYSILQRLWKADGRQFKELATACCCSQSTITGIIDTMEKNKLVRREMNPNDRRSLLVKLTEKGKSLQNSMPPRMSMLKSCCGGLDPNELNSLIQILEKLSESFESSEIGEC